MGPLDRRVQVGAEAQGLEVLRQQALVFVVPGVAGGDASLGLQLLQGLVKGQHHVGGGGEAPLAAASSIPFHWS